MMLALPQSLGKALPVCSLLLGWIFKVFIEFVTISLLFYVLVFWLQVMWDPGSLTRGRTHTLCAGNRSPHHWTTMDVLALPVLTCSGGAFPSCTNAYSPCYFQSLLNSDLFVCMQSMASQAVFAMLFSECESFQLIENKSTPHSLTVSTRGPQYRFPMRIKASTSKY